MSAGNENSCLAQTSPKLGLGSNVSRKGTMILERDGNIADPLSLVLSGLFER